MVELLTKINCLILKECTMNKNQLLLAALVCYSSAYPMSPSLARAAAIITTFSVGTWANSKIVDGLDSCHYLRTAQKLAQESNKHSIGDTQELIDRVEKR